MYKLPISALICSFLVTTGAVLAQPDFQPLPDLGDTSGQIFTPEHDRKLGTEFMRLIRQEGLVLDDEEVTRYLRKVGRKLALNSENPGHGFTFFLVNDKRINAFAGPGGYIGTNVGLFTAAERESELAGVLAHEIAHVTQRHLARAFDTADKLSLANTAALLAAILIGTQDGQAGAAALTAASALSIQQQINFTRANEKEADRVGIRALAGAGYDPHGMAGFFEKLQKNAKLYGTRPPEFLSTHPVTINRIAEATSRAEAYPAVEQTDEREFQLMRAKLRVAGYESPRQVLLDFQRYHGDGGGSGEVERYEYALLLAATKRHARAAEVMRRLHAGDRDRLAYRLGLGRILAEDGKLEPALSMYRESLELYPDEIIVILPYANTLMTAGKNEEAYKLLSGVTSKAPEEPKVYKLLAQAAGKTRRPLQTHTAMAEHYYLNGYTAQAVEQMKLAEKTSGLSNYQAARIQARLATLERELKEED